MSRLILLAIIAAARANDYTCPAYPPFDPAVASDAAVLAAVDDAKDLLASLVDARSLALYADGTAKELTGLLEGRLAPLWSGLRRDVLSCVPCDDQSEAPDAQSKAAYVRSWAAQQRRCARCGKAPALGSAATVDASEERFMHLCGWLVPRAA